MTGSSRTSAPLRDPDPLLEGAGPATEPSPTTVLLGFARALRAAGLRVTGDRERTFLLAAAAVGLAEREQVYWAGRAALTSGPSDATTYDRVFTAWFGAAGPRPLVRDERPRPPVVQASLATGDDVDGGDGPDSLLGTAASDADVLRHRDVATLAPSEKAYLARLFGSLPFHPPTRPSRRRTHRRTGAVDGRATLREQLRRLGEPGQVRRSRRRVRPRPVVLLIDVSGSMEPYADSLLRLAHAITRRGREAGGRVETFTLGSRLTHVTRAMHERDSDRALITAGDLVPDWSGGTRLGQSLQIFLDRWGRRGTARGAVVVIFSDGWECQDPQLLGEQVRRLSSVAHQVIWANPHRGRPGYEPVQAGMAAALPHVHALVAGHSWAAFEELGEVIGDA